MSYRLGSLIVLILASVPILILTAVPIYFLILASFTTSWGTGAFTLANISKVLSDPALPRVFLNTLAYGAGGGFIATALGTIFAWILIRVDIPGKRILEVLVVLALSIPMIIKGFGWIFLLSPRIGLINITFMKLFGTENPLFNIYSMPGLILALGVGGLPLCYLNISAAMNAMDPSLEESSRIMGSNLIQMFRKVTIPVLRPAIFSAFMLIFIVGMENFDYPFILGLPARIETLATRVYDLVLETVPPNPVLAAGYGLIYLILTFISVSLYIWSTRRAFQFVVITGKAPVRAPIKVGTRGKILGLFFCVFFIILSFGLPIAMVALVSLLPFYTVVGKDIVITFTFSNYVRAVQLPFFWNALTNSLTVSTVVATVCTFIATFVSYATLRMKVSWTRVLEYLSALPLAFPGIVFGLGLMWSFIVIPVFSDMIYGTIYALILGLLIIWLPFSTKIVSSNLIQISDELEDASYICGASWGRTFRRVLIPLLKLGLANSFVYIFLNSMRELGAVILLVTPRAYLLVSLITDLFKVSAAEYPMVSAISVLITLMMATFIAVTRLVFKASIVPRT